jgi:pyrroline-5-carboxylate reductase
MRPRLLVVGGGRMGAALVRGLQRGGWPAEEMAVVEVDGARRHELAELLPGSTLVPEPVDADGVVLAVKPASAEEASLGLAAVQTKRWLSIMAGITLARLETWAPPEVAVVRAMPNTAALVGAGISAVSGGTRAQEADLQWAESVLGAVGQVLRLPESALDAVTGVSGSGPAYVFLLAEALSEAGVQAGLEPAVSRQLAVATVVGAGRLLAEPGAEPEMLRAQVTSPGGTTEAAVSVLEAAGLRRVLADAVATAAQRSREMAQ